MSLSSGTGIDIGAEVGAEAGAFESTTSQLNRVQIIPPKSDKEVDERDLVSSNVDVPGPALPTGVDVPLRLAVFFTGRFVDELERDKIRENFESRRFAFGRPDSGSFQGSVSSYKPVSGSGVGAELMRSAIGKKA